MTPWEIDGLELGNCNCSYACPCQFNALPTDGSCEAAAVVEIERGHYGSVTPDGLRAAWLLKFTGAVHEGNGQMQVIIDERATPEQRDALETIMTDGDTEDMATMWWVFSAMSPHKHPTLFKPIHTDIDVDGRRGRVVVEEVLEIEAEPIRNPVTGAEHRVRIDLPQGFEYRIAEIGSATTVTKGAFSLQRNNSSYGQFNRVHLSHQGVLDAAA